MKTSLRRSVAAAALLMLIPTMAACGFDEQTDKVYQGATGVDNRDGKVYVLNAAIVSSTPGSGTFAGSLVNTTGAADALVSITGADAVSVPLPSNGLVNLATNGSVRLQKSTIKAGSYLQVTLQFRSGQTTTLNVPVVAHEGVYAGVPVASPSA